MSELQTQIDAARMQVHTDSYPMSIGELVNLYEDGELDIHPEFQRVYRWSEEQKSKLIESIILGIPLPSIFVAQRRDGVWDVVDGLQRISTILSFMGKLKNQEGEIVKPLKLLATKYLPALEGKVWENPHEPNSEIDLDIKRVFKREKLDIKIIKRESEGDTKFELFQRLNTGGSKLSDQEVRNCMLLMLNEDSYTWLKDLASDKNFINTTPLSEKQNEECYNQELALRFIVQRHSDENIKKEHSDVAPYLNAEMTRLLKTDSKLDLDKEKATFTRTFKLLNQALEDCAFKKYNHQKNRHEGAISLPVFEALTVGVSYLVENSQKSNNDIIELIRTQSKALTNHEKFIAVLDKRSRPIERMTIMADLGKELFA
ncbi:DUF262 domain-containing protein [Vibrio sp. HS-50-1]|uniref:DUF262 domain-containing protein n=1 Tax=Vibrio sp. HS-50-1 TaxID=2945079 RepID=UPI00216019CE|nr:DUF262 domain-containing protein [Vibrio sp. HS-50-1]MCS0202871.1 DUF262 domain-containing protein [Vibrio sp. HS-50-1]